MEPENKTQEKLIEVKIKNSELKVKNGTAIVAIIISVLSFILSVFSFVRPFDKDEIIVTSGDELGLLRGQLAGTLLIFQDISVRNVGKKIGDIATVEGLIVSQKNDKGGNPIYKKYLCEVNYNLGMAFEGKDYTFLNWVLSPNEWHRFHLSLGRIKHRDYAYKLDYNHKEFDNFDAGDYEYLLTLKNDKNKYIDIKHYQFSIKISEVDSIVTGIPIYVSLTPLQNQQRITELLKIQEALKIAKD